MAAASDATGVERSGEWRVVAVWKIGSKREATQDLPPVDRPITRKQRTGKTVIGQSDSRRCSLFAMNRTASIRATDYGQMNEKRRISS
jgi:hypothetical protein